MFHVDAVVTAEREWIDKAGAKSVLVYFSYRVMSNQLIIFKTIFADFLYCVQPFYYNTETDESQWIPPSGWYNKPNANILHPSV